jgi:hypothetical protein
VFAEIEGAEGGNFAPDRNSDNPILYGGDASLIGKGLQQFDVPIGKTTNFISCDDNGSNRSAIAEHGHRENASPLDGNFARVLRSANVSTISATSPVRIARLPGWSGRGGRGYMLWRTSTTSFGKL